MVVKQVTKANLTSLCRSITALKNTCYFCRYIDRQFVEKVSIGKVLPIPRERFVNSTNCRIHLWVKTCLTNRRILESVFINFGFEPVRPNVVFYKLSNSKNCGTSWTVVIVCHFKPIPTCAVFGFAVFIVASNLCNSLSYLADCWLRRAVVITCRFKPVRRTVEVLKAAR